MTIYMR